MVFSSSPFIRCNFVCRLPWLDDGHRLPPPSSEASVVDEPEGHDIHRAPDPAPEQEPLFVLPTKDFPRQVGR